MIAAPVANYPHVSFDERNRPVIGLDRLRIDLLITFAENGGRTWVESILENYPTLKPAEVHAGLAYYFDHREEIDAQRVKDIQEVEDFKKRTWNDTLQNRLADAKRQRPT